MAEYNQKEIEKKWQERWEEMEIYRFDPDSDKPVYSIDNPPRYASGALHVGHAIHYTHIDFAARYHRMRGYNVFFPLCFDVNGIPIEERVERKLGITRKDIDRHKFNKLCSEFAEQNIEEMTRQFKILGESMDPSIYYQTNAEYYRRLTQISFIQLYRKGLIYKGEHPINWCPRCMTALADAEIEYVDRTTKLSYVYFELEDGEKLEIATTRPELLCTCQIVAVNPSDERAKELVGKKVKTPIFDRRVEIIEDDKVDPSFGTGIVMICTIGDKDDLEWVYKYDLPIERGIDEDGRMTELAGKYKGLSIEEAREAIIKDLKGEGLLTKQEDLEQSVGTCWRCHTPIEFLVMPQWFLKLLDFKKEVLKASEEMEWFPEFMKIRLEDWINSLTWDWVISRQRYFATPIPVWECVNCDEVVIAREEDCYVDPTIDPPPVERCPKCNSNLKGCEDVFDTWMDSSISPLYNTFWGRDEMLFKKLYPMSLRPQSHDIIRTWAFYTILRGLLLTGEKPFKSIMISGFILASDGTPMHASKGNAIDPLEILEKYGTDALRYFATTCAMGKDTPFRMQDVSRGVSLITKLYNIERFVGNAVRGRKVKVDESNLQVIDRWILSKYSKLVENATVYADNFQFDKLIKEAEFFIWHEFADHYIEMVKHRVYETDDENALFTLYTIGLGIAKLLAPFLPHATEEVYNLHFKETEGEKSIHISGWPEPVLKDEYAERKGELIKDIIARIRNWKSGKGIALNAEIAFVEIVSGSEAESIEEGKEDIAKTVKAKEIVISRESDLEEQVVKIKPRFSKIGPTFKERAKEIAEKIESADLERASVALERDEFEITLNSGETVKLSKEFVELEKSLMSHGREVEVVRVGETVILIET